MKKLKALLAVALACVFALGLSALFGCVPTEDVTPSDDKDDPVADVIIPIDITLDVENVKVRYASGEDYSAEGLVVTLTEHNKTQDVDLAPRAVDLSDKNLTIDSSDFDNTKTGTYTIVVSYSENEQSVEASYEVSVKVGAGIVVEKSITTYPFVKGGVEVDLSDVTAYLVGAYGDKEEDLESSEFELSAFFGKKPVALNNNKFVAEEYGVYNVWAKVSDYQIAGSSEKISLEGFVLVYVTDTLTNITINDTSVTTQPAGSDIISKTWTFTATYSSGATKQLTAEDVEIEGLNTATPTTSGVAKVTYTELDAKGESMAVTTDVSYVITEKTVVPGQTNKYSFSLEELKAALGGATVKDKTELTSEAFNGSNAFITATIADPKKDIYRIQSSYDCIEINKGTLSVTFEGTGTLKIAARSTSSSNVSDIGLIDEAGNYVSAVYDTANTNIKAVNGYYTVTGKDFIEMTFEITQPGTYTIISNISGDNNRAVRINTIVMVDNY